MARSSVRVVPLPASQAALATLAALAALATLAVTGCAGATGQGRTTAATSPATASINPGGPISPAPGPAVTGQAGPVTAIISGLPAHPSLAPGGAPLTFTVTLRNPGGQAFRDITPVVSLGHCACTGPPIEMAPAGTLQERDPASGTWRTVMYNPEGGGTDFLLVVQQPAIALPAGGSAAFTFRVAFSQHQRAKLRPGSTAINVAVVRLPAHSPIGQVPAVSVPVQVRP